VKVTLFERCSTEEGSRLIRKKLRLVMDKLKLTGQNLGRVFNFACGCVCLCHAVALIIKTAKLKVENSTQTTFSFSPVSIRAPWISLVRLARCKHSLIWPLGQLQYVQMSYMTPLGYAGILTKQNPIVINKSKQKILDLFLN